MNRAPRWVFALLLLFLSIWFYRDLRFGSLHDDLHDYQQFMEERAKSGSEREFLWRVLSFDRVRGNDSKVNFLFRPGLFGMLAAEDIYWREVPAVSGWISIALHTLCILTLFLLLTRFTSNWLAFALSAILATYSQGAFMILWRMIVPYTIALLLFVAGVALLYLGSGQTGFRKILAVICFFLSALFNETAAFWVPTAGLTLYFLSEDRKKSELAVFFLPAILFFSWSLADLTLRAPEGGVFSNYFAPFSNGVLGVAYFLVLAVTRFFQSLGYYTLPFFLPQGASLSVEVSQVVHFLVGLALLVAALLVFRRSLPAFRSGDKSARFWFMALGYPFWIILMIGIFRVTTRGYFYLGASSYYCYTVAFFLLLTAGVVVPKLWNGPVWVKVLVVVVLANQMFFSQARLRKNFSMFVPAQKKKVELLSRARLALAEERCLVWSDSYFRSTAALPPIYLYRKTCGVRKGAPVTWEALQKEIGSP